MTNALRKRTFELLDSGRRTDRLSRIVDFSLMALIALNVLAVLLESMPELHRAYAAWFGAFETLSVLIFTVEYGLRVWSSIDNPARGDHPVFGRLRYMLTPMAMLDLIVILPFYLVFFVTIDLRFLRVLRLLRVFRLTRYSTSMSLLLSVLRDEARAIGAALFVLLLLVIMAASLVFLAEHERQPEAFRSIPAAMWWAVITMTSVGYGDVTPVTAIGKFMAAIIAVISIGMVALPAGLLASGFNEALRQRREQFTDLVEDVLEDGTINDDEREAMARARLELGLSGEEAAKILKAGQKNEDQRRRRQAYEAKVADALRDGTLNDDEVKELRDIRLALGLTSKEADKIMEHKRLHAAAPAAGPAPLAGATCPHCGQPVPAGE